MKRTKNISKQLFIRELEQSLPLPGVVTTFAVGEEALKPKLKAK